MEGQFLVRQIYDDEITYNIIGAAVEVLSKYIVKSRKCYHFIFSKKSSKQIHLDFVHVHSNSFCILSEMFEALKKHEHKNLFKKRNALLL